MKSSRNVRRALRKVLLACKTWWKG